MVIRIRRDGRVDCRAVLPIPLPAAKVWGQIRDFHTFARLEFFHAQVVIEGGVARPGAGLQIDHRFFLFRVRRVGRICRWKEGEGFAFSDLSGRGMNEGFPHVFGYRIQARSENACDVEVRVAGKWTARMVPRWMVWLWMRWIMQFAVQQVERKLLLYRLWLGRQGRGRESGAGMS